MGLIGKLICQTSIKTDGDVFHEIFGTRPHHLHTMTPENIHGCDLHEGEFGKVGSFIIWKYSMDGKQMVEKHRVEAIDEEQKQVTYKVIEGELLKSFKIFLINVHVDTSGVDNLVTWSFDYEKVDESIKDPTEYLDFVLRINKDIETHHLPK
ncbi:MLP-like protein 34-like [Heracleum sosnowskyi]|uniref:MLP-like protein 34-like n=1 Tax=Heracleum sosnowskyi TaxID=360622 RepID=A0AAD8I7S8_9APIA|nr:MLP-like protein 34-like [Heracleum sosnowskyi]